MTDKKVPIPGRKPIIPCHFSPFAVNEDVKKFVRDHEKSYNYFYNDSRGNPTIGVGQMIPNADMAKQLPLHWYEGDRVLLREANEDEKVDAYTRLKKYPLGRNVSADAYNPARNSNKNFLNLRMRDPDVEFMFERRLREGAHYLHRAFSDFPTYPAPARKALQDMEFQVGPTRFTQDRWPNMFDAVKNRNWERAARESQRDIHDGDQEKK